jgi:peptidyl-tRNA hydrolase, PTH1 family
MKFLIAGLGNIGVEYANTRHNIGFQVLDELARSANLKFEQDRYAYTTSYSNKGKEFILIKPTTYMNLSGKAINYWLQKEKIAINNLLVIVDDLALDFGTIRIKANGSHGGHNGLTHIEETLKTKDYPRLRFGIGNNFSRGRQVDFVLGEWSNEEKKGLPERIDKVIAAIQSFGSIGLERTMNFYNGK